MGEIVKNKNICAVAICPSPPEASYHRFPKDKNFKKSGFNCANERLTLTPKQQKFVPAILKVKITKETFVMNF